MLPPGRHYGQRGAETRILLRMTLTEIIAQLEACRFECKGGPLELNEAFIGLKEIAELHDHLIALMNSLDDTLPEERVIEELRAIKATGKIWRERIAG